MLPLLRNPDNTCTFELCTAVVLLGWVCRAGGCVNGYALACPICNIHTIRELSQRSPNYHKEHSRKLSSFFIIPSWAEIWVNTMPSGFDFPRDFSAVLPSCHNCDANYAELPITISLRSPTRSGGLANTSSGPIL